MIWADRRRPRILRRAVPGRWDDIRDTAAEWMRWQGVRQQTPTRPMTYVMQPRTPATWPEPPVRVPMPDRTPPQLPAWHWALMVGLAAAWCAVMIPQAWM